MSPKQNTQNPDTPPAETVDELQNLPAAELLEKLPALSPEQLKALRELEAAEGDTARADVLAAIDARLGEGAGAGAPPPAKPETAAQRKAREKAEAAAKAAEDGDAPTPAAKDGDAPAWQHPDYDGPLTIPQGAWRRAHIKPVREVRQK